jgi:hypothetical protein
MSKVQLQGNVSGTGVFTIASPNSNTDRTLTLPDSSGTIATTGQAVTRSQLPTGTVLQVVQGIKTDTQTIQTTSWVDVVSVSITPTSATNRIMIVAMINSCQDTSSGQPQFRLDRNGTPIGLGDAAGSRNRITSGVPRTAGDAMINASLIFLDSPATTSALTYKIQANPVTGTAPMYINRTFSDPDQTYAGRAITSIVVMEVSA